MPRKRKLDDLMEAIAFAEAGETDHARRLASELFPDPGAREGERILSVSGAPGFSPRLVDQSIGMAERLAFGVVALSVAPAMAVLAGKLGVRTRVRRSLVSPETFGARAAERNVPFVHTVRGGDPERAVEEVRRTFRRIAFLLVEPGLASRARFATLNVPIFFLDER
jgi:hypothetical protein